VSAESDDATQVWFGGDQQLLHRSLRAAGSSRPGDYIAFRAASGTARRGFLAVTA
jgi:hypothetical protein